MNVNKTLFNEIASYLNGYDCNPTKIEHFLNQLTPFCERQSEAIQIIKDIMTSNGKKELFSYVAELARVQQGTRELKPRARDHVVHALLTFILGIYINEKFLRPPFGTPVDDFQWKLAGLFHDIGYPAQVAKDILRSFTAKINTIKRNLGVRAPDVYFKVVPVGLENLTNDLNSFDLIQKRLNEWGLQIDTREEYDQRISSGDICHGMMSSLAVLYVVDLMYQKCNPKRKYSDIYADRSNINCNQTHFEKDVISACSAIYVHDLPNWCFANAKIDRSKSPVAFLLRLSDCLQEWERPSLKNPTGFSATQFGIEISNEQINFRADIPDDKRNEIRENISSSLVSPNVRIY